MGRVILTGGVRATAPVSYKANFADNTWAQIIDVCQKNKVPDTWTVGSQKTMTINGTDYPIDIIGKNHDTYSDGSGTAPLTFQMHDCYGTGYTMTNSASNSGGWTSCLMRTTHLPAIMELMPSEVKVGIKEVNKLTSSGNKSSTIVTTADKLFLLSEIEISGTLTYSASGEGRQYSYYSAGNSRIKNLNGSAKWWWERSPRISNTADWCMVLDSGEMNNTNPFSAQGVSFAFCF